MSESVKIVSFDGTVDKWKSWKKELMAFYGVKSDKTIKKLLRGDLVAPIVEALIAASTAMAKLTLAQAVILASIT